MIKNKTKKNIYSYFSLLFFTLLILSLVWLGKEVQPNYTVNETVLMQYRMPSRYFDKTITTEFNVAGKIDRIFRSQRTAYFEESDTTETLHPVMHYVSGTNQWTIQSQVGILLPDDQGIELHNNVEVIREDNNVKMYTSSLLIRPEKRYAQTTKPVTILTPSNTTKAIGMIADLQEEKYDLLSSVNTLHQPRKEL